MSKIVLQNGKRIIDTGLPQRQIKPIWLEMHKEMNLKIMDAILNSDTYKTISAIKLSISMVLDDEVREQIKENIKNNMDAWDETHKNATNEERLKTSHLIHIEAMEGVSDYLDQAFGISHRLAIGID